MSWGAVIGAAGAIGGSLISKNSAKQSAEAMAKQGQLDPRIAELIFGKDGQQGLIGQYQQLGQQPRSDAANNFANANANYLSNYGGADLDVTRNAALNAIQGNSAPTMTAAQSNASPSAGATAALGAYATGSPINAPSQNNINLSPTFQSLLGGGNTDKLMQSLQAGNALTNAQFAQNTQNVTDNLQRSILPGIRSGAIASGQFGGSRQGIAEGLAISDATKQMNNANTQIGLANSANTAAQLAGSYENGQNRALSAAQGLSGQQYQTAFQDASTRNQAEFMNVQNVADYGKYNAGLAQNNAQFNASQGQQNNQFNAGLQQQAGLANQNAQLGTNAQNNSSSLAGAGLLSGLLGGASSAVNANDNWNLTRAQGVNSLLQPYLSGAPTQNGVSSNSGAAALGGGLAGLSLGNSLGGLLGGGKTASGNTAGGFMDLFGSGGWGTSGSYF